MEYNSKNAKRWSIIGQRPTLGLAIQEAAESDENIIAVVADVTGSAGLSRMQAELPSQVINVGIAEQNMMGIATGLASEGFTVFTSSFAPFQSMRCLEQIRVNQGYMKQKLIMVGLASGVAYGELGFTHCCIEDLSLLRSIPNVAVVSPADCMEVAKCVEAAIKYDKSVYIRLMDTTNVPIVYNDEYEFEIGRAVPILTDGDVAILANGTMVSPAVNAAKQYYEENGKNVAVYDFHTVKPVDEELLLDLSKTKKAILTIEEHSLIGGLGSAVSDYYSEKGILMPVFRMGFPDEYCHGAQHKTILNDYNLNEDGIKSRINRIMEVIL